MSLFPALLLVAMTQISADDVAVYRAASLEWKKLVPAGSVVRLARNTDPTIATLGSFFEMELARAGVNAAEAKEIANDVRERNREAIIIDAKLVDVVAENANLIAGVPAYDAARRHALVVFRMQRSVAPALLLFERSEDTWRVVWKNDYADVTNGVRMPQGPAPLRVGGDVKAPVVRKHVNPVYTNMAKERGIQGIVIAEVVIDETGHVTSVQILKPLPFGLDAAAVDAVRQWEFEPGTLAGKPVAVIYNVTVAFRLDEK